MAWLRWSRLQAYGGNTRPRNATQGPHDAIVLSLADWPDQVGEPRAAWPREVPPALALRQLHERVGQARVDAKHLLVEQISAAYIRAVPTIDLPDGELAAVTAALRRAIEGDRYPRAPRLDALRAALARLEAAAEPGASRRPPRRPKPTSGGGRPRRLRLRSPPASSWAGCRPTADRRGGLWLGGGALYEFSNRLENLSFTHHGHRRVGKPPPAAA